MGKKVENMTYTFDENTLSDLHKDARGWRPRGEGFWSSWNEADDDGKEAIWTGLLDELDETMKAEAENLRRAKLDYEKEIAEVIALGAGHRERALLWMVDDTEKGMPECPFDVEAWMWARGLLGETKIEKELVDVLKPIWKRERFIAV